MYCVTLNLTSTHLDLLVFRSVVNRTLSVLVQRQSGPVFEQPPNGLQVASGCSKVQRSRSVSVPQVRVDSLLLNLVSRKLATIVCGKFALNRADNEINRRNLHLFALRNFVKTNNWEGALSVDINDLIS